MTTALLLQTSRWRDAAHDAVLTAAARELDPVEVVTATADPDRTERMTGLPSIPADRTALLKALRSVDAIVLVGGRPLASGAGTDHLIGLADAYALSVAARTAGKRFAMIGVAAGPLTTRRDAFFARRLMIDSALAVLDEPGSAELLIEAGVPSPVRVGSHLAWLELQQPPETHAPDEALDGPDRRPAEELWAPLTRTFVDACGGPGAVADRLADLRRALGVRLTDRIAELEPAVAVQGWRSGTAAGDDIETATAVVEGLRARGVPGRVVPPALTLADERDVMSGVALCVTGHPHALMAASAAGVPLIAWPYGPASQTLADWLGVPVLPGAADRLVDEALARAGDTLPVVRQQIATAGEVVDLLRTLLTDGGELPRTSSAGRDEQSHWLRPTGVMR